MTTPMLSKVWTQRQGIQPWWSAHTQHLDLQVTTCEGLDPTWTVWDGHKRLAGGTAPESYESGCTVESILDTFQMIWNPASVYPRPKIDRRFVM